MSYRDWTRYYYCKGKVFVSIKGFDKIIGVTDSIYITDSGLKGRFDVGGITGQISGNGEYFRVVGTKNTLCAANLMMDRVFFKTLNWLTSVIPGVWNREHEAIAFEDALIATAKICSTNPCNLLGLSSEGFGCIKDGAKADICVLNIAGTAGNYAGTVNCTTVDGKLIYSAATR